MGETARALGLSSVLEFEGKKYKVGPGVRFEVQAAFEQWLEGRAKAAVNRMRRGMSPEEYQEARNQLVADIAAGTYSYGSPSSVKAISVPLGQKEMLYLILAAEKQDEGCEVTRELVDRIFEQAMDEVLALLQEMNTDPNLTAPAQPGQPSPSAPSAPGSAANRTS